MKKIKYILFLFAFAFLHLFTSAQTNTDLQLAQQFYDNKEFEKALDYYEKLYNKVSSEEFYTPYLNCLLELKEFKKAEKVVKKQIKHKPESPDLFVDLGTVYERAEDSGKSKNSWELAIKSIKHDDQVFIVARAFMAIKQYDYAITTYLRGRKMSENDYPFSFELADVHAIKGDRMAMINEYLDVLESQDSYIQSVQNALQTSFGNEADAKQNELLKAELLKRISKKQDKTILSELLIWMQIQQKDFEGAFIQAKALDKRKKEEGSRLMNLAKLCTQNESYDVAVKAYQYVISKGSDNFFYANARMELLDVSYQKIVLKGNYNLIDLTELEKNYQITITELGKSASTVPLLKNLAHLQAFYLNKPDDAIALLGEAIVLPQLSLPIQAECKLELADILLMTGDIWEASLRYSQVEKSFKYDAIGQEAKFRNAKISYYTGDFMWAQAQLDVLKGATAKLIANDAMDLSLLISDALAIDTNVAPLMIFSRADLLAFQNKDEQAKITLDSINTLFPNHALADDILYKKAKIVLKHGNYMEAAVLYDSIVKTYGDDILGDDALFKLAELNESQFKNLDKAKELYQQLLIKFPGSLYVVEARKRFRKLRGDTIN
ncbi:MAG: tetratricopeptide repeat protein [Bacteroidetes bacterium]|nr:tetratricopeptide repeat protein [Bacteroidota bacterium]